MPGGRSDPIGHLRLGQALFQFGVFAARRGQQVAHAHRLTGVGGQEGGVQGDIVDAAAGEVELGELVVVQPFDWRARETP